MRGNACCATACNRGGSGGDNRNRIAKERGRQRSSGLQKRLRGPYFRWFLTHGTTMGRRTVENPSSRIHFFASEVSTAHAPRRVHEFDAADRQS
jgi:hypothetical protein